MRTIEKTIYNITELEEDVKQKTIEKLKEQERDFTIETFLNETMEEKAIELLKKYFKSKAKFISILYNLDYSQGSGAMIEFNLQRNGETIKIRHHGFYYHERSFTMEYYTARTDKEYETLREKIATMNEELGKFGYNWIENAEPSDDDIMELCESNNYEFYADGKLY